MIGQEVFRARPDDEPAASNLAGVGVAVTRAEGRDGPLSRRLRAAGARPIPWQSLGEAPPDDPAPLAASVAELERYHWIVFTSARAVAAVVAQRAMPPPGPRVAAVGPATARVLAEAGWPVHLRPDAEAAAAGVPSQVLPGAAGLLAMFASAAAVASATNSTGGGQPFRVLYPASALASDHLESGLTALGATVERVTAYRLLPVVLDAAACQSAVSSGEVAAVTFASPSAIAALVGSLGGTKGFQALMSQIVVASIGQTTSAALRAFGRPPDEEASRPSLAGLVNAVARAVARG